MATKKTIAVGSVLLLVVLTASFYMLMPEEIRIDFEKTRTVFKVYEDGKFVISGIEYTRIFDGTSLMRANNRNISYDIGVDISTWYRIANFKEGIIAEDFYEFDNDATDVETVPISHEICFTNAKGKIFEYMIDKITYDGETKDITSPFSFGKNMNVTFQDGYYRAKVYNYSTATDKIKIRYRITDDHQCFDIRLFDPEPTNLSSTFFYDDFNRGDNSTVGNGWAESEPAGTSVSISGNTFYLNDTSGSNSASITRTLTTTPNTTFFEFTPSNIESGTGEVPWIILRNSIKDFELILNDGSPGDVLYWNGVDMTEVCTDVINEGTSYLFVLREFGGSNFTIRVAESATPDVDICATALGTFGSSAVNQTILRTGGGTQMSGSFDYIGYCDSIVESECFSFAVEYYDFNITNTTGTFDFYPTFAIQEEVEVWGQTNSVGAITIHNNLSEILDVYAKLNETNARITLKLSNSSTYSNAIILNTSYQLIFVNLTVDDTQYLWAWADYNAPTATWDPELEIKGVYT